MVLNICTYAEIRSEKGTRTSYHERGACFCFVKGTKVTKPIMVNGYEIKPYL